jgi:hypothetical protein
MLKYEYENFFIIKQGNFQKIPLVSSNYMYLVNFADLVGFCF